MIKKWILLALLGILLVPAVGCESDEDNDEVKEDAGADGDADTDTDADSDGDTDTDADSDTDSASDSDTGGTQDYSCLDAACANPDGNTHTDCTCDADYCVPDVDGVESAGLTRLTCIVKDCSMDDPETCPPERICQEIPSFVIDMMKEQGIEMPSTLCAPQ